MWMGKDRPMADHSNHKLAIITGATGGIGREISLRLARRGYRTILIARGSDAANELADDLSQHAPSMSLAIDLTKIESIETHLNPVIDQYGPADVLVNNAGSGTYTRFLEQSREHHAELMNLNYFATAEMTRLVLPGMVQTGRGHVINIASMSSKVGPWGHAGYATAKSAVVSLTQTLAAEHSDAGVHFTFVNPGIIDTPYFHRPQTAGLWDRVRKHAISPTRIGDAVERVLDRPRLEICVPRHFRWLIWLESISPKMAHAVVAAQSRPLDDKLQRDAKPESDQPTSP